MKSTLVYILFFLFISTNALAEIPAKSYSLRISEDRLLSLETHRAQNSKFPHLLFLPGINRGLVSDEIALQKFAAAGFGFTLMSLSTQPFSLIKLEKTQIPYFLKKPLGLSDFADEIDAVVTALKKAGIQEEIIPVSLSFSGAITPFLKKRPVIFETVPMTSSAAANPDLENYRQMLIASQMWNPIFGPAIIRQALDAAYRHEWEVRAKNQIKQFSLPEDRLSQMIEGYTSMSRSIEGFDWNQLELDVKSHRVFILAENESPSLLKDQTRKILKLMESGHQVSFYMVKHSGHVVPADQPQSYIEIFEDSLYQKKSRYAVVDPHSDTFNFMSLDQAKLFLKDLSQ